MRTQQIANKLIAEVQGDAKIFLAYLQLKEAHDLAAQSEQPPIQFAPDLALLTRRGSSKSAIQWLLAASLTEHFRKGRRFTRPQPSEAKITENSRFLLSERGLELARMVEAPQVKHRNAANGRPTAKRKPYWNDATWELWFDRRLIKRYSQQSPNQFLILESFQELKWQIRIDNPLPVSKGIDPHKRLLNTVQRLNHGHQVRLIGFHADANGKKIRWEICPPTSRKSRESMSKRGQRS